ncbi:hypothetical protein [Streptomyces sp. SID9124]|nr:hypothetical protein [Streptomyces sp. SID9124]
MAADNDAEFDLEIDDFEEVRPMGEPAMCGVTNSCFDPGCVVTCQ